MISGTPQLAAETQIFAKALYGFRPLNINPEDRKHFLHRRIGGIFCVWANFARTNATGIIPLNWHGFPF